MLKRLRLNDFKSFVDEDVPLAPLTLLLGANASGKSNFLDALQFLHANSFDLDLEQILNGEQRVSPDAWRGLRGGASEAARLGTARFTIESDWSALLVELDAQAIASGRLPIEKAQRELALDITHRMTCRTTPQPLLEEESLIHEGGGTARTGALRGDRIEMIVLPPETSDSAKSATRLFSAHRSVFLLHQQVPRSDGMMLPSVALAEAFSQIEFLNIQPSAMRGYGRRNAPLGGEGRNISGVLARLCDEAETKRAITDWLAEFCAPEIADIDFVEVKELGDVMAMLVEKSGRRVSVRSASDGTLRFLGTLLALRLAPRNSVILLEELDSGLHPTRIKLLVEYLETVTRERGIQVIATTHSPVILQWLSQQTLRDSLVFGRVPDHEGTLVRRLGDLPHFDEVVRRKGIDELFTTGWMEMAL
ncbi:AAA family ATPase [Cystobacter fuscus]|uniref:AAA family ATPase n=1 Tax=Cystobacter fuscus TaxID=43 RepID=UPI002B2E0ECE|nr:AAA family ATPase [Cystobacter fuscus]